MLTHCVLTLGCELQSTDYIYQSGSVVNNNNTDKHTVHTTLKAKIIYWFLYRILLF